MHKKFVISVHYTHKSCSLFENVSTFLLKKGGDVWTSDSEHEFSDSMSKELRGPLHSHKP